jgi:hypothetical protein
MKRIICIKARSHTDFELYLISEKHDIPYDFLSEYKKDISISKFWTEEGSGRIMAIEELNGNKKTFTPIISMSLNEQTKVKQITPIIAGSIISKYRGDIEAKEKEFKDMNEVKEKHRKEMLARRYDPSNIVCINAKSTLEQLFAICIENDIDFVEPAGFILSNNHLSFTKIWYEKGTSELAAYEFVDGIYEQFEINDKCLIPRDALRKMSRKTINTPKIKSSYKAAKAYQRVTAMGFELDIPKLSRFDFERDIEKESKDIDLDVFSIEDLQNLLDAAIENEDYESAAELRDAINEMKRKNK